jgi:hypothetical protein
VVLGRERLRVALPHPVGVLHPDRPRVLMLDEAGAMALPGVELEGEAWTADAAVTAAALRELLGFDALLLCSLEGTTMRRVLAGLRPVG